MYSVYRRHHIKPKIHRLRKRRRFYQSLWFWALILTSVAGVTLGYFVLFSPKFQVSNVVISGNEKMSTVNLESMVWSRVNKRILAFGPWSIFSKSILILNKHALVSSTLESFPLIHEVVVEKQMPDTVYVNIEERKPFVVACTQECFLMDRQGIIYEKVQNISKEYPVVYHQQDNVDAGQRAIDKKLVDAIYQIVESLKNNFEVNVLEISLTDLLVARTSEGWSAYFDPKEDMDFQIHKMNILLRDEVPAQGREKIQYIYLQYKDKAYYK